MSTVQSILNKGRKDKFLMVINIPKILKRIDLKQVRTNQNFQSDTLQFSVYGSIVPRIQVPAIDAPYGGSTVHISSHAHPPYAPIKVSFTIDNEYNNYWVIYSWLNVLRDQNEGVYGIVDTDNLFNKNVNLEDYSTDMTIYGLDEYDKPKIKWTYKTAFPITLGEIDYNYRITDEIETFFEFAFHKVNVSLVTYDENI